MLGALVARAGYANLITGSRLLLVAVTAALLAAPAISETAWFAVLVSTVAATFDLLDGWVARRTNTATRFGARFDMEVDAALIMTLSGLAWSWDKAGAWVLASGLLRYLFLTAGLFLPWMRAPLSPSLRRKVVCVIQIVVLIVIVAPIVVPPYSVVIASGGLAVLTWSFLTDTWTLWNSRSTAPGADAGGRRSR